MIRFSDPMESNLIIISTSNKYIDYYHPINTLMDEHLKIFNTYVKQKKVLWPS